MTTGNPKFNIVEVRTSLKTEALRSVLVSLESLMEPIEAEIKAGEQRIREESVSRDMAVEERQAFYKSLDDKKEVLRIIQEEYDIISTKYSETMQKVSPEK